MLKFHLIFFTLVIFLFACGNEPGNGRPFEKESKPTPTPNPIKTGPQIKDFPVKEKSISVNQLHSKVFESGNLTHFTDSCKFKFECDCCFGEMIFKPDNHFYYLEYCMLSLIHI